MMLICTGAYALVPTNSLAVSANMEETQDRLKVFIGDVNRAPEGYAQQRAAYIEDATITDANTIMEAIIGFNDYYTVEAVIAWAESHDISINRAYMWPKGETGRLSLYVEDGDIESSIEAYKQQVEESSSCDDPIFAADYQRFLDGEYEIFALTVTASAQTLKSLSAETDYISYIDVMYNAEAETYARKVGKTVSYIELPTKPDGAF